MKIQYFGDNCLKISTKKQNIVFDANQNFDNENFDISFDSDGNSQAVKSKKNFNLPGEFEVSEVLSGGFFTEKQDKIIYKIVLEDTSIVNFGKLDEIPLPKNLEQIGENIDIAIIQMTENFPAKKIKEFCEKIEPRMFIITGDPNLRPELSGITKTEIFEDNPIDITKNKLKEDTTEIRFFD